MNIPSPPLQYHPPPPPNESSSSASSPIISNLNFLKELADRVSALEDERQAAYDVSRRINVALVQARQALEDGSMSTTNATCTTREVTALEEKLSDLLRQAVSQTVAQSNQAQRHRRSPRLANLSNRMEEYVSFLAYRHFLVTGTLLPPSAVIPNETNHNQHGDPGQMHSSNTTMVPLVVEATDEEYLSAIMTLTLDLQRYGLGRATVRDVSSVTLATELVDQIMNALLQFDFRNGPLRRKYDATAKYALKALETILYELAVTTGSVKSGTTAKADVDGTVDESNDSATSSAVGKPPDSKRVKSDDNKDVVLIPTDELTALQQRMEHRDELREALIKKSRDGQKAAKQSIFALHRGDFHRADHLLKQCQQCIHDDLLPIVQEEPSLRTSGSFVSVLEEYVEAKLFAVWLYGNGMAATPAPAASVSSPIGTILQPHEFGIELEPEEYVGGLCDLTGEIGRHAVKQGTARQVEAVKLCLGTNRNICKALMIMERLPSGIGKKMDQVRRSVEKLERMLYEISLSEAAGGRNVHSNVEIQQNEDEE